jgi:two-component system, LytTR family, sensor histidine kinase AlgZ
MHPIFRGRKLGLYLLAWLPVAYAVAWLLHGQTGAGWAAAAAVAVPLCLVYAFLCLSAWYACRALPPHTDQLPRLVGTHFASAAVMSGLWVGAAAALVALLPGKVPLLPALPAMFALGAILYLLAVAVNYVILAVEASREAEEREAEARVLAGQAELRALKAQINPHFLFNSLHSISALTTIDPGKAREMCVLLSNFLRSTLGLGEQPVIPLGEELAMARSYLAIERVRLGERLRVEEAIAPGCEAYPVPPLLLQPLVENAVVHGIANLVEPGVIRIGVERREEELAITIENSFDPESLPVQRAPGPGGTPRSGFGLVAAKKRLAAHFDGRAALATGADDGIFRVEIRLPLAKGTDT